MVVPTLGKDLLESPCIMCGQCIHACPVGAIGEVEEIDKLLAAIADPDTVIVTQIAPAVRVLTKAIGKKLGADKGTSEYLYGLFPYGPGKQACKIAGLPKPTGCI